MPDRGLESLAEAQRQAARALAALVEELRAEPAERESLAAQIRELTRGRTEPASGRSEPESERSETQSEQARLERALEAASSAVGQLGQATTQQSSLLAGLTRQLGDLPSLLLGLAGERKSEGGGLGGLLKAGLGLPALGLKIAGLFRRERREDTGTPIPFLAPPPLALEVANTENILAGFPRADRGQRGEVRVEPPRPLLWQPQITVNVQAMDSQSFLDHSGDIARAVREAMLNMHPMNDLISEL